MIDLVLVILFFSFVFYIVFVPTKRKECPCCRKKDYQYCEDGGYFCNHCQEYFR